MKFSKLNNQENNSNIKLNGEQRLSDIEQILQNTINSIKEIKHKSLKSKISNTAPKNTFIHNYI